MITATGVELTMAELAYVLPWAPVLDEARRLVKDWNDQAGPTLPLKLELVRVELDSEFAALHFERYVPATMQRFSRACVVSRALVEQALVPAVWQYPMQRAVQQLIEEVPALGFAEAR